MFPLAVSITTPWFVYVPECVAKGSCFYVGSGEWNKVADTNF